MTQAVRAVIARAAVRATAGINARNAHWVMSVLHLHSFGTAATESFIARLFAPAARLCAQPHSGTVLPTYMFRAFRATRLVKVEALIIFSIFLGHAALVRFRVRQPRHGVHAIGTR